jgi:hypothetical protein
MKKLIIALSLLALTASSASAITLKNYERNNTTLDKQRSPKSFVKLSDAYISYKYVGGLVLVLTFSVPNLAYHKEFYLLRNSATNDSVKARFARSKSEFNYGQANAMWLGTRNGRDHFVMRVGGIFNPNGPYALYAKIAGKNIPVQFTLK